jgi:hypothetical protein
MNTRNPPRNFALLGRGMMVFIFDFISRSDSLEVVTCQKSRASQRVSNARLTPITLICNAVGFRSKYATIQKIPEYMA